MTMLMQVASDTEQAQFFDRPCWLERIWLVSEATITEADPAARAPGGDR